MTFPTDFDIFLPLASTTKPWVSTWRYGALCLVATDVSRELWNHPRCWSLPSRYMSAGHDRSSRCSSTAAWLTPESNQTSRMSSSLSKSWPPHSWQTAFLPRKSSGGRENQESAPSSWKSWTILSAVSWSINGVWHCLHINTVMGTPHARCLEMHQSGRASTMP